MSSVPVTIHCQIYPKDKSVKPYPATIIGFASITGLQVGGGPILPPGCPTVLIGGLPAARVSDMCTCVGPPDVIVKGSFTVLIGGMPAARMGDPTAHGGAIVIGFPKVLIG